MTIGEKIKQRRIELGWSQRELCNRMGYSNHSTITKIEAGKVDVPQSRIVQFAEVLNTTIAYLMDWEDKQKKNDTLSGIILRMRSDDDFFSVVKTLGELEAEQFAIVKQMLSALKK